MEQIGLSGPDITQQEIDAVASVLRSGRLSIGPQIEAFERAVCERVGATCAVGFNSGTSALHCGLIAAGIGPGDEIITTPFSFIASSNCILMVGATPVFVDIDPDTWNIDPHKVADRITDKTRGIIAVDVFGQPARLDILRPLADKHNLLLVEDSCEALGAALAGQSAGTMGDFGAFGFYPNKQITTGEGGMLITNNADIASTVRALRNQGRSQMAGWLDHDMLGYNFRLSEINAAVGVVQMQRLDEILGKRAQVATWYLDRLQDDPRFICQKIDDDVTMSWFVFTPRLSDDYTEQQRNNLIAQLREQGVGCSNYFAPIHLQGFYRQQLGTKLGDFPICERVAGRTIALPFHNGLTEDHVDRVCRILTATVERI